MRAGPRGQQLESRRSQGFRGRRQAEAAELDLARLVDRHDHRGGAAPREVSRRALRHSGVEVELGGRSSLSAGRRLRTVTLTRGAWPGAIPFAVPGGPRDRGGDGGKPEHDGEQEKRAPELHPAQPTAPVPPSSLPAGV